MKGIKWTLFDYTSFLKNRVFRKFFCGVYTLIYNVSKIAFLETSQTYNLFTFQTSAAGDSLLRLTLRHPETGPRSL